MDAFAVIFPLILIKQLHFFESAKMQRSAKSKLITNLCPGADSNCHTRQGATPSKWCVYQFRHLGIQGIRYYELRTLIIPKTKTCYLNFKLNTFYVPSARRETRTLKDITPTASETATFTNFAIRAMLFPRIQTLFYAHLSVSCP